MVNQLEKLQGNQMPPLAPAIQQYSVDASRNQSGFCAFLT